MLLERSSENHQIFVAGCVCVEQKWESRFAKPAVQAQASCSSGINLGPSLACQNLDPRGLNIRKTNQRPSSTVEPRSRIPPYLYISDSSFNHAINHRTSCDPANWWRFRINKQSSPKSLVPPTRRPHPNPDSSLLCDCNQDGCEAQSQKDHHYQGEDCDESETCC